MATGRLISNRRIYCKCLRLNQIVEKREYCVSLECIAERLVYGRDVEFKGEVRCCHDD